MSDRFFLDTNILVYSVDLNSPNQQVLANNLVRNAIETRRGVISYQVVQEFFSFAFRFLTPMELDDAERYLATTLPSLPTGPLFLRVICARAAVEPTEFAVLARLANRGCRSGGRLRNSLQRGFPRPTEVREA